MRISLALIVPVVCASSASGCLHAQTGPILGYTAGEGVALGWEGGAGAGVLNATLGGEVRPLGAPVLELYAAGEPSLTAPLRYQQSSPGYPDLFLSIGATGGFAVDEHGTGSPLVGGWLGVPWTWGGDCREHWLPTASLSLGVHVFLGRSALQWTVYVSPKLGLAGDCPDLRVRFPTQ